HKQVRHAHRDDPHQCNSPHNADQVARRHKVTCRSEYDHHQHGNPQDCQVTVDQQTAHKGLPVIRDLDSWLGLDVQHVTEYVVSLAELVERCVRWISHVVFRKSFCSYPDPASTLCGETTRPLDLPDVRAGHRVTPVISAEWLR